ncbi:hypothetical protein [Paraburkholderia sp. J41]|uniref:hypothetical protein n=1 Tax=Paraburkholderia sp. J41 TaxID=2805433 RepID=UPI002AC34EE5|nr:hypothetical protein [Paraburkholderia sp. J41]
MRENNPLNVDAGYAARKAWLKQEQRPQVRQHSPQSNFEQSWPCRIGLLFAAIVIGISVFSPDPQFEAHGTHAAHVAA